MRDLKLKVIRRKENNGWDKGGQVEVTDGGSQSLPASSWGRTGWVRRVRRPIFAGRRETAASKDMMLSSGSLLKAGKPD